MSDPETTPRRHKGQGFYFDPGNATCWPTPDLGDPTAMKQQGHRSVQQHRAYKDRARGDDLVAEATSVAARWDPSPTEDDVE